MKAHIKENDQVFVLSGKDKGKEGVVVEILAKKGKVLVKGVAVVSRHTKARRQGESSEIKKQESYISWSNVMVICNSCKKPSRTGKKNIDSGAKVRICNRCKEIM